MNPRTCGETTGKLETSYDQRPFHRTLFVGLTRSLLSFVSRHPTNDKGERSCLSWWVDQPRDCPCPKSMPNNKTLSLSLSLSLCLSLSHQSEIVQNLEHTLGSKRPPRRLMWRSVPQDVPNTGSVWTTTVHEFPQRSHGKVLSSSMTQIIETGCGGHDGCLLGNSAGHGEPCVCV